jgi:D-alanyl-D-alanine carboxypeptidase
MLAALPGCGGGGGGGSSNTSAEQANPTPPTSSATTLQGVLDEGIRRGVDGLVLAVLDSNGSLELVTAGIQDRSSQAAMDGQSLFKVASVSKLFIAAATTQIIHQGLLSLEDTLAQHLPELASSIENSEIITLRNLLQHRSGVPDFDSQTGFSWQNAHTDITQVLEYALGHPADFPPNARYEYSNTNYLLIAMILDKVLGYSHRHHIQDFILDPLGMDDTYHLLGEADPTQLISGYWDDVNTTQRDYVVPGGSMVSTATDVVKFIDALARGALLNPQDQATYEAVYWLKHSGWLPGYQTIANYESTPDVSIVLHLNNTGSPSEGVLSDTYDHLLEILRR